MTDIPRDPTPARTVRALMELLGRVSDFDGHPVQVTLGGDAQLESQVLMLGDLVGDQSWAHIGNRARDEDYTIELFVLVAVPGDTDIEACERAWGLLAQVSTDLRQPDSVALAQTYGVLWNELTSLRGVPTVEAEGHGYAIQAAVRFRARI